MGRPILLIAAIAIALGAGRASARQVAARTLDARSAITFFIADGTGQSGFRPADRQLAQWAFEAWARSGGQRFRFEQYLQPLAARGVRIDVHALLDSAGAGAVYGSAKARSGATWFLRAAAASCVASLVAIHAAAIGVSLRSVDVTVDSESDDRGILGLDPSIPAGPLSTRVVVAIDATALDRQGVEALAAWAVQHCPVSDAIARAVPLELELL